MIQLHSQQCQQTPARLFSGIHQPQAASLCIPPSLCRLPGLNLQTLQQGQQTASTAAAQQHNRVGHVGLHSSADLPQGLQQPSQKAKSSLKRTLGVLKKKQQQCLSFDQNRSRSAE
jgi:hypothetical protein